MTLATVELEQRLNYGEKIINDRFRLHELR